MRNTQKRIIEIILFIIYPAILYLILEYLKFGYWKFTFFNIKFFMNNSINYIIISYFLFLSVMLIIRGFTKSSFLASLIGTVIFTIVSIVSYFKFSVLATPFIPQDLTLIGNVGEIAKFGIDTIPNHLIMAIIYIIIALLIFFLIERKLKTKQLNIMTRTVLVAIGSMIMFCICISANRYTVFNVKNADADNYNWIGPNIVFFMHMGDFFTKAPDGYNQESVSYLEAKYKTTETYEDGPNVILIMNESFSNPNKLTNVTYSKNPMESIERLDAIKGEILSPIFGGGTSIPEFEVLTGLTSYFLNLQIYPYTSYIRSNMNSIVRLFNQNGYITTGIHPYTKTFYNRWRVYNYLGFNNTVFKEDIEEPEIRGNYISDNEAANQIVKQLNSSNQKQFIFTVTMQNHMRYDRKSYDFYDIEINSDVLGENEIMELQNYVQGVYDSTEMYMRLVNMLKQTDKPTILIMFGDHLPVLGSNLSTYLKNGFEEESIDFYKTPYIIWANYDINIKVPELMSPSNLGLQVLRLANIDLPWYLLPFEELYKIEPALSQKFSNVNNQLLNECEIIQYDLLIKKKYIPVRE